MEMYYMNSPTISYSVRKLKVSNNQEYLATAGAIKGTSQKSIYEELGFESLKARRRIRQL